MPLFERNSSIRVDRVAEPDENVWISLFDGPPNVRRVHFLVPVAAPESNFRRRCAVVGKKERDEHRVAHSILSAAFRPRRRAIQNATKERRDDTIIAERK